MGLILSDAEREAELYQPRPVGGVESEGISTFRMQKWNRLSRIGLVVAWSQT